MPIRAKIIGRNGKQASVNPSGELVVGHYSCNTAAAAVMTSVGQGYTLIAPVQKNDIIIDGVILNSNKSVSATDGANIELYTSAGLDSAVVLDPIINANIVKLDNLPLMGLNLCVPKGVWVNAKTDDATVNVTVLYYYRPTQ